MDILAYDDAGIHLAVDSERRVVRISVFSPNRVTLAGIELLGRKVAEVAKQSRVVGLSCEAVDAGLWYPSAGVLLVEVEGVVDGVEVGAVRGNSACTND